MFAFVVTLALAAGQPPVADALLRVYDAPPALNDARLTRDRETRTIFSMTDFESQAEWEAYADALRQRIRLTAGLNRLPELGPVDATIETVAEHDDYIVERVHFTTHGGLLVTGNLYRPTGPGPFPGIVCPHGHWSNGRLEDGERGSVAARSITFARMGIVSFTYDMLGYNDSKQLSHAFGSEREKLWGIHPFATQVWAALRVVDFLAGLPYVDPDRLGCTGASGGGTQTFALVAIDPRIKVAAPVNMISHTMQGGCICENAPIIRHNASNMEIGALMAPRPLLMVSATGDWTKRTPEVEYPAIKSIFALYGAPEKVAEQQFDAPHNYNQDSRTAVYRFFGKWLLGEGEMYANFTEPDYALEPIESLKVFPDGLPDGIHSGDEVTRVVIETIKNDIARGSYSVEDLALIFGEAASEAARFEPVNATGIPGARRTGGLIRNTKTGAVFPATFVAPKGKSASGGALLVHSDGKDAIDPWLVMGLAQSNVKVMAIDPFQVGEHHYLESRTKRESGNFPDTFLPTDTAYRVHDILNALARLRAVLPADAPITLIGLGDAGVWSLLAAALEGNVNRVYVDAAGFDPDDDEAWVARHYVPCIRSVGDVAAGAGALGKSSLRIAGGEGAGWQRAVQAYTAAGGTNLSTSDEATFLDVLAWLEAG
jgi:hypothetical protein